MTTTTEARTTTEPETYPAGPLCPSWCRTDHRDQECHYSETVTFGDFQAELGGQPNNEGPILLYVDEPGAEPMARALLSEVSMSQAAELVQALQWARRTDRMTFVEQSPMNAALSLSERLYATIETALDSDLISDAQRRNILLETHTYLCAALASASAASGKVR